MVFQGKCLNQQTSHCNNKKNQIQPQEYIVVKKSRPFFQVQDFGPLSFARKNLRSIGVTRLTRFVRMQKAAKKARRPTILRINVQNGGKSLSAIYSKDLTQVFKSIEQTIKFKNERTTTKVYSSSHLKRAR
jgi:hypothetical protein